MKMFLVLTLFSIIASAISIPISGNDDERLINGADRTINSVQTTIDQFPYQVSVKAYDEHVCGGALIHRKLVLTSATCLHHLTAKDVTVRAQSTYHAKGGLLINAEELFIHPTFDPISFNSDIAVIKLASELPEDIINMLIHLPPDYLTIGNDKDLLISGWGTTSINSNKFEDILRSGVVRKQDSSSCKSAYGNQFPDSMLCAKSNNGQGDVCWGDQGSPLAIIDSIGYVILGVASFGKGCGSNNVPGVYTNIQNQPINLWIRNTCKTAGYYC